MKFKAEKFHKTRPELEEIIDNWIFNKRDRQLMKDKLLDGLTFEQLAEKHGLTVRHTKTLYYDYYKNLDKILK